MRSSTCPFPKIFPSQLEKDDLFFMQHAYNEAINAWNADEVPVGAVIRFEDQIIATAHNQTRSQKDPTAHAEMIAITMAAKHIGDWRLNECQTLCDQRALPHVCGCHHYVQNGSGSLFFPRPKMGGLGGATSLHELGNVKSQADDYKWDHGRTNQISGPSIFQSQRK